VSEPANQTQRIDHWLWCARFFKTRTLASKFVQAGNVRITRGTTTLRAEKPSFLVRPEDVVIFMRHDHLRIIKVIDCASRRGPASEAQTLYEDQSPPRPQKKEKTLAPLAREKGSGRPTKKDRRRLDALKP